MLSSKEIDKEYINYWRIQIPCLMCEMKKYLCRAFFNAQENYLIHQVEEIEMRGPVHTRYMFERHLKSLKDLVRQRARPEGSIAEGYMIYQIMIYITKYLPKIATAINMNLIWNVNSMNKFEGEHLLGKGRMSKVRCK